MTPAPTSAATITDWHAHVYFDAASRAEAWAVRQAIEAGFDIDMGRFHERPVGPHPCWSFQVAFRNDQFAALVPWLALNRRDLVVFIHPNTGEEVADHRDRAIWMGAKLDLDLGVLDG
jgi:DOPA 4,5-dioxygenase